MPDLEPDLWAAARRYLDGATPPRRVDLPRLGRLTATLTPEFGMEIADHFERQPMFALDAGLLRRYRLFQAETMRQYEAIAAAGIRVLPWLRPGQPYSGSQQLSESVRRTGRLHVFLTRDGHGPGSSPPGHPMLAPSGVRVSGVNLCHNDIFRAVHDVFGHVMFGNSMGPAGELRAAYGHLAMYPPDAHPVLFCEHVSQICWFFYGAHLRDESGRVPERGAPGWIPPGQRPYPPQKVFACPPELLDRFRASFTEEER